MSEIEVPTEHLHETINEHAHAHHGAAHHHHEDDEHGGQHKVPWTFMVALSSALLAVLAAIAALLAGHHVNEALLDRIHAADQWSHFQAKGIKAAVIRSKLDVLIALDKPVPPEDLKKLDEYQQEQANIEAVGHELEQTSDRHLERHNDLARTVTVVQIAIALSAIAVISRRHWLWTLSLVLGAVGAYFFVVGIM